MWIGRRRASRGRGRMRTAQAVRAQRRRETTGRILLRAMWPQPRTLRHKLTSVWRTRSLLTDLLPVQISPGKLSVRKLNKMPHELPGNVEGTSPRRFAFSAFPARISGDQLPAAALSVFGETYRGPIGTSEFPLDLRDSWAKLSESPATGPPELPARSLSDPGAFMRAAASVASLPVAG